MNNIDIQETQLWTVALVGSFYNNLRKLSAHKPVDSAFSSLRQVEPLHLYITNVSPAHVIKIVLNAISQDTVGEIAIKKQIVANVLGEYESAALACEEYLNRPSLQAAKSEEYIPSANAHNYGVYGKNVQILRNFSNNFEKKLTENIKQIIDALAATEPTDDNNTDITDNNSKGKHAKLRHR